MKEKIMPSVVVTLVCAIVCGLLAAVNAATADRIVQAEADKVQRSLAAVFGEDTYTQAETSVEYLTSDYSRVTAIYQNSRNYTIYDVTADGYAKGGIRVLVGIAEDGSVAGVGFVSCGETAGIGTRVTEDSYLAGFSGATGLPDYPDMISGATFSSRGLRDAVQLAQACFAGFTGIEGGVE